MSLFLGVRGRLFPAQIELFQLNGTDGVIINGIAGGDLTGSAVAAAGDINDDGISDFLIGAPGTQHLGYMGTGQTYGIFGKRDFGSTGLFELSQLNGSTGFSVLGMTREEQCGYSVFGPGDLNADGIDDIMIGAPKAAFGGTPRGHVYILFGGSNLGSNGSIDVAQLNGQSGFVFTGYQKRTGHAVAGGGDLNADGISDLVVGSPDIYLNFRRVGSAFVWFGSTNLGTSGSIPIESFDGTTGFSIRGDSDEGSGYSVSCGDFNADGIADLLVGAPQTVSGQGGAYVLFGRQRLGIGRDLTRGQLDGTNGFTLLSERVPGSKIVPTQFGFSVATLGDINADGVVDLGVGTPYPYDDRTVSSRGKVYVVFGRPGLGASGSIDVAALNGSSGFVILGESVGDHLGWSISSVGDMNGDEIDDFAVGAPDADLAGARVNAGRTYVLFGKKAIGAEGSITLSQLNETDGFVVLGERANDRSGFSLAGGGDVNADRSADLLVGAPYADPSAGRKDGGIVYVVYGRGAPRSTTIPVSGSVATSLTKPEILSTTVAPSRTTDILSSSLMATSVFSTRSVIQEGGTSATSPIVSAESGVSWTIFAGTLVACGVISSLIGGVIGCWCRRHDRALPEPDNHYDEYESTMEFGDGTYGTLPVDRPTSGYLSPKVQSQSGEHYVGDAELQGFNQQAQHYLEAKQQDGDDLPNF